MQHVVAEFLGEVDDAFPRRRIDNGVGEAEARTLLCEGGSVVVAGEGGRAAPGTGPKTSSRQSDESASPLVKATDPSLQAASPTRCRQIHEEVAVSSSNVVFHDGGVGSVARIP